MSSHPLRIAYFIDRLIHGGTELQLVQQINMLEGNGAEQLLFCLYESNEHEKIDLACPVEILNISRLRSLSNIKKMKKAVAILKMKRIQIVQTYFFDSTFVGVLCGRCARVNAVISCRRDMGFWYTPRLLFCLNFLNKITDRILVNSEAVRENVIYREKVNAHKVDVISNGIQTIEFVFTEEQRLDARRELGLRSGETLVGIIANMDRRVKRVDLFIEAAKVLSDKNLNLKFAILGEGALKPHLVSAAKNYGIQDQVIFLGKDFNKKKLLAAMDIGVITSDSEGLSNSILEYMASNTLVIASDVPGNKELIQNELTGYLFEHGNAESLAACIVRVLLDKNSRKEQIAYTAKNFVRAYDWSVKSEELQTYYQSLV